MLVTERLDGESVAVASHVETKLAIEVLRDRGIRYRQHKLVERMHTERIGFGGRRDIAANGGHYLLQICGVIGDILAKQTVQATGDKLCPAKRKARRGRRALGI